MIRGSCLCGGVRFEVAEVVGPFELCHCTRCRKLSGAAAMPAVGVRTAGFRMLQGADLIRTFDAPILYAPPAYRSTFCGRCGSPVPPEKPEGDWFELAAGLLDDDPGIRPDKHIFTECVPDWDAITDEMPQYDLPALLDLRHGKRVPPDFVVRRHGDHHEE